MLSQVATAGQWWRTQLDAADATFRTQSTSGQDARATWEVTMRTNQVAATPRPRLLANKGKQFLRGTISIFLLGIAGLLLPKTASARSSKGLEIYFVDVEGGQATLVVSPLGESVLIDTGWAGTRDASESRLRPPLLESSGSTTS
jgi:hypothetical protein